MSFRFASPAHLSLLVLIPLLLGASWWLRGGRDVAPMRFADIGLARTIDRSWRLWLRPVLTALRWLTLALAIVAMARPQLVDAQQLVRGQGVDIALALDISGSMSSLDFEPQNRLEAAKQVIEDFVSERPYDRIGLTVFASEAFAQSPLTIDHEVLKRLLADVDLATRLNIDDGTAIGLGLANAANMLKDSAAKSKVIILLTDGINNRGQIDPLTAAEAAKALGIKVYTIGAGRTGIVPVPQQTLFGERVVMVESELDEETLWQIADTTGGLYFRAEDTAGLRQIYEEINSLEKSDVEIRTFNRYEELAPWLLWPAFLLFLLQIVLKQTVLRSLP